MKIFKAVPEGVGHKKKKKKSSIGYLSSEVETFHGTQLDKTAFVPAVIKYFGHS